MGVDQVVDRAFDSSVGQRIDHDPAFPRGIGVRLPVLDGAAAAGAEMRTERRDPLGACAFDTQQQPAVGMVGDRTGFDGLAASVYGTYTVWPPVKATPSPRWPT